MTTEGFERKLTAILSADVKGYSRLMREDEEGTIRTLTVYRKVMAGLIGKHRGRVVDSPGDNVLAEFKSVVDALRCGVEIQKELKAKNADLPEDRRMEFRIGINLGDVVEEGERIYGDGVNIAARVEGLAEPGGICVSGSAFEQVKNKLELGYEHLGEQTVKGIAEPVRVYRVLMEPEAAGKVIGEKRRASKRWKWMAPAAVAVIVAAVAVWYLAFRPTVDRASVEKMAFPLPEEPSLAVLPFVNMSGDPEQEYIADGFTENIITALSKIPRLFVIARSSTFVYKGKATKVQQVAEDLGVRYVLEGSLQKSGDKVRITAQLIDALSGKHIWADRYDRDLKDLFTIQDQITLRLIQIIRVKLTEGEQSMIVSRRRPKLQTVLKFFEATSYLQQFTKEGNATAKKLGEKMILEEPDAAGGYIIVASALMMDVWFGLTKSPRKTHDLAVEMAQKAISLGADSGRLRGTLSHIYAMRREYEKAIQEGEMAVALEPNGADVQVWYGIALMYGGKAEEAIPFIEKGIRLNPYGPIWYYQNAGLAHLFSGQHEKALAYFKQAHRHSPQSPPVHRCLAVTYALLERQEEARAEAEEVMRLVPNFSLERFGRILPWHPTYSEMFVSGLRKAGLPD